MKVARFFSTLGVTIFALVGPAAAQLTEQKISDLDGGFTGTLDDLDQFGFSMASPGDLDGDGIRDLLVGAPQDDDGGSNRGSVWQLFLNTDGTVKSHLKISSTDGGFTGPLLDGDLLGSSVATIGDLDGDSVDDLAIGAAGDDDGAGGIGGDLGAIWITFMNSDGTVKAEQKISALAGGLTGPLADGDNFAASLAPIGDLDGDGVVDLVAGAPNDGDGSVVFGSNGAVWILFLNTDGTVKADQKISSVAGGLGVTFDDFSFFGSGVAGLGDADGDGIEDIAVGSQQGCCGEVWIIFLNTDGTVKDKQRINESEGSFSGTLDSADQFGGTVAALGDLDLNGVTDIGVGAIGDDDGGSNRGAVWVLRLNSNGTVADFGKFSDTAGGFAGTLDDGDGFGSSIVRLGDLDSNGSVETTIGARFDDDGGSNRGAIYTLFPAGPPEPLGPSDTDPLGPIFRPVKITGITPAQGPLQGGNTVTITGCRFRKTTTVSFGNVPSPSVTFVGTTELQAVVPALPVQGAILSGKIRTLALFLTVDVTVAHEFDDATLPSGYTYTASPDSVGPTQIP